MELIETPIEGLLILKAINFVDRRGSFQKIFNYDFFRDNALDADFREIYYSVSSNGVIRGMHFQTPPFDHTKLVNVSQGRIKDVVLDLRKGSDSYLKYFDIELDSNKGEYLYIPKGLAHGFLSLENDTIVNYAQTTVYSKEHDCGILYNSFGYDWEWDNPIISDRDLSFEALEQFKTPFL